jgi:hypothetical protein
MSRYRYADRNELHQFFYKITSIYLRAYEDKRRHTVADPLDYVTTHVDNAVRWKVL